MKSFFSTFIVCLIVCFIGIFFFGLITNVGGWLLVVFFALLLTILVRTLAGLEERIEQLEKKLGVSPEETLDDIKD